MIDVDRLSFDYPDKRVLRDICFSVPKGAVTALVGPNGAGKTTLLRCIAGLERPVSGRIRVSGIDVQDRPRDARRRMGYLSDFFGLYATLTVEQHLLYMAGCQKIGQPKQRADSVIELLGLGEYRAAKAHTLSRGWRQRLGVGLAIVHEPEILLLDEPASGMDPEARIELSRILLKLQDAGMTIVVSSHVLAELEDYSTDMLVLRDGRMTDHVFLESLGHRVLRIGLLESDERWLEKIAAIPLLKSVRRDGGFVLADVAGDESVAASILAALVREGLPVTSFTSERSSMQDAYMKISEAGKVAGQ